MGELARHPVGTQREWRDRSWLFPVGHPDHRARVRRLDHRLRQHPSCDPGLHQHIPQPDPVTGDTPGSGEPRPPDPEPPSPDPGAVTAPYTPAGWSSPEPPPAWPPASWSPQPNSPPPAASAGNGLPPGVGWAAPVPVVQEVAPGLVFSSTGARWVAWFVDVVILGIFLATISGILDAVGLTSPVPSTASFGEPGYWDAYLRADPIGAVLTVAVSALYFVGSWTGGRRATL